MMCKVVKAAAVLTLCASPLHAVVVVDGVPGGDADNTSPFETLAAAVAYASANLDPVVEIHTNTPIPGLEYAGVNLATPVTIRPGTGFTPTINTSVHFLPLNDSQQVTLEDLVISTNLTDGPSTAPLNVGCNLTAINCTFNSNPAPGIYQPAVTCAVPCTGSESTLTLTSCTLVGHTGLEAGRSCKHYEVSNCIITGQPTDLDPRFSTGITNSRNFRSGLSSGPRMGAAEGFVEISIPRTLNLANSVIKGGMPLGWPPNTASAAYVELENTTFGPVNAVNCVFVPLRNSVNTAQASVINNPLLPQNQNIEITLRHCTFQGTTPATGGAAFGFLYFPGTQPETHTISNCFFDGPSTNYAIFNPTGSNQTLQGDGNSYNIRPDRELIITGGAAPGTPFEATQFDSFDALITDAAITDNLGNLLVTDPRVVNRAIALAPPVTTDKHGDPRPMPVAAPRADIGADEINESSNSHVNDWAIY